MTEVLTGIEIARLEEGRQARAIGQIAYESRPFADGVMCYSAPASWSNTAVGVGLTRTPTEAEIDEFESWYVSKGVEPRLELAPFVSPEFIASLSGRGFTVRGFENTLARSIGRNESFRGGLPDPWPAGLSLELVDQRDDAMVDRFVRVVVSGFVPPGQEPDESMIETAKRGVRHPAATSLGAWVGEGAGRTLAGGAGMEAAGEVAALYGVTVLEPYRRRGIQQAMIVRRLELARDAGCRVATIGSKPGMGTERNVMRMGFHVAYTKVVLAKAGEGLVASPG